MKRPSNVAMFCGKCMKVKPFFLRDVFYICETCGVKIKTAQVYKFKARNSDLPEAV